MRFASLGSGSKGNATLVDSGDSTLLIDCGFSIRETERRFRRLNFSPENLTAILVTHEHSDHLRGVMPLARKYGLTVYMTPGTSTQAKGLDKVRVELIKASCRFDVGDFQVTPVAVPHDAREPVQYLVRAGALTLGVLTDLGRVTPHLVTEYRHCDGLLLEANHDVGMLKDGPYPRHLQKRVGGDWGHLNNVQSLNLLQQLALDNMQHLVLGHISQKNNSVSLLKTLLADIEAAVPSTLYACQDEGFGWLDLCQPV